MINQKHLFDLPEDITYLNIASQSPLLKSSYEAGMSGLLQKSHPHTITLSDYFEPVTELKQLFAKIIDAEDYNSCVTIPSVSYGMATVAKNIKIKPGDEIVVVDEQFPSNMYSWRRLAKEHNAKLVVIAAPQDKSDRVANWNSKILNSITDSTVLVTMGNIHWSNGSLFDLKAIRTKTKVHNSLLIIDGSQTIGAFPFSVQDIQPDALVCAGYKWLFGPYGCAYAYFGEFFNDGIPIEENWSNRLHSENFAGLTKYQDQYKPLANRYNVGESGNFIYVKMQIEALKQLSKWNPLDIQNHCKTISSDCVSYLQDIGCHIEDPNHRTHHLFGVELSTEIDKTKLKQRLKDNNIFVSFRGDYIRISSHLYNTKSDFDILSECISSELKVY